MTSADATTETSTLVTTTPGGTAACGASPYAIFTECPHCAGQMRPEHAHYRCASCGWRDSCCD